MASSLGNKKEATNSNLVEASYFMINMPVLKERID